MNKTILSAIMLLLMSFGLVCCDVSPTPMEDNKYAGWYKEYRVDKNSDRFVAYIIEVGDEKFLYIGDSLVKLNGQVVPEETSRVETVYH